VLGTAVVLAVPVYGQPSGAVAVGFSDRLRVLLALLLQGVGGGFAAHGSGRTGLGPGFTVAIDGGSTLSLTPLAVTVLWIAALYVGLRRLRTRMAVRTRTAGLVPGQQRQDSTGTWARAERRPGDSAAAVPGWPPWRPPSSSAAGPWRASCSGTTITDRHH
jgi:hypothetical protein